MTEYAWSGLGMADGADFTDANSNTPGNGDTVATGITKGTGTTGYIRYARPGSPAGPGLSISGISGDTLRIDPINPAAIGHSIRFVYTPSDVISGVECSIVTSRNNNATPSNSGYIFDEIGTGVGKLGFRGPSGGDLYSSPALIRPNSYQIDWSLLMNTTTTPTVTNGRQIGRVRNLTNPASWNSGNEYFFDTGYVANVTTDLQERWRLGKPTPTAVMAQSYFSNIRWRDISALTVNTSTVKANAITNFVQDAGPAIATTGTGEHYVLRATSTPLVGGALTYSITQLSGVAQTPVLLSPGVWIVDADATAPLAYSVTVSEAGGSSSTITINVPTASTAVGGQFQVVQRVAGVWQ